MRLSLTKEFSQEYEAAQDARMRKRLEWFLAVSIALSLLEVTLTWFFVSLHAAGAFRLLELIGTLAGANANPNPLAEGGLGGVTLWSQGVISLLPFGAFVAAAIYIMPRRVTRASSLRIAYWVIVAPTLLSVIGALVAGLVAEHFGADQGAAAAYNSTLSLGGLFVVFVTHFFACVFLPWLPLESFKPMVPVMIANAVVAAVTLWGSWLEIGLVIALMPMLMVPGMALCWLKHSQFRKRFGNSMLRRSYGTMRSELSAARQIHDAMFPAPITDGPIRVEYRYEPMRQIGGDYVTVHRDPESGVVDLILLDVTGHGVTAALTVNRLHGEISRLIAQSGAAPSELLTGLNRYLHKTLATHSIYATAVCFRFDPQAQTLEYASAGHPPAFLAAEGAPSIEQLQSTTFLLGVVADEDFVPNPTTRPFKAGDRLVAYTDGATEALDTHGRQLRVSGLERLVRELSPGSANGLERLAKGVESHRDGPASDDTLLVEVRGEG